MTAPFLGEKRGWVDSNVCCRWNPVTPKAEVRKLWWRPKEQGAGGGVKKDLGCSDDSEECGSGPHQGFLGTLGSTGGTAEGY